MILFKGHTLIIRNWEQKFPALKVNKFEDKNLHMVNVFSIIEVCF